MTTAARRIAFFLLSALVFFLCASGSPPPPVPTQDEASYEPARSLSDERLRRLQTANRLWGARQGPKREAVDVVCLVPDLPTFLEAISAWDDRHFFPILIEDGEYTLKFLRAYGPSRVVRYPSRAQAPKNPEALWQRAVEAVGRSWTARDDQAEPGDTPPRSVLLRPPGAVVSEPGAPMLSGAVALAAGRFQPLIRWRPEARYGDEPTPEEADRLLDDLYQRLGAVVPKYDKLGDDCDFLTMALDYPYRYDGRGKTFQDGPAAFDDLIGRFSDVPENTVRPRWAYTGRLLGDETRSLYAAMCGLFLTPERAAIVNTYGKSRPYGFYRLSKTERLDGALAAVDRIEHDAASLKGWHELFDPVNRAGLVFINSAGGARGFKLSGPHGGRAEDVPISDPAFVHMVHSFSAQDPNNEETIAGRWLANGAYVYFGSVQEPYLLAFRVPDLVVDLLLEGLPAVVACRLIPEELPPMANPWRLAFLGDPLRRPFPSKPLERIESWAPIADWPAYGVPEPPGAEADAFDRLGYAVKAAIEAARSGSEPPRAVAEALLAIDRRALPPRYRTLRDLLLADTLFQHDELEAFRREMDRWPLDSIEPPARRWIQTARIVQMQRAIEAGDWRSAADAWRDLARAQPSVGLFKALTERVAPPKEASAQRAVWARLLRSLQDEAGSRALSRAIQEELQRLGGG